MPCSWWRPSRTTELVHEALAIVGCRTPSALTHAPGEWQLLMEGSSPLWTEG